MYSMRIWVSHDLLVPNQILIHPSAVVADFPNDHNSAIMRLFPDLTLPYDTAPTTAVNGSLYSTLRALERRRERKLADGNFSHLPSRSCPHFRRAHRCPLGLVHCRYYFSRHRCEPGRTMLRVAAQCRSSNVGIQPCSASVGAVPLVLDGMAQHCGT